MTWPWPFCGARWEWGSDFTVPCLLAPGHDPETHIAHVASNGDHVAIIHWQGDT